MSDPIIEMRNLTKRYKRGDAPAVDNLNLTVSRGAVFGFIGPNGAGKSTTLRMLAGLLEPSSGEIMIAGKSIEQDPMAVRRHLGYMPDFFGVYHEMTAGEYLDFFANCYQISAEKRHAIIPELLELVRLSDKRDEDVGDLSRGMQQRLCLARSLVHDPDILLLDEPASGLDPRARVEMRELLRELATMGKTIIISSHILSELAELCNEVGIIESGRIVANGPVSLLQQAAQGGRMLRLHVLSDLNVATELMTQYKGIGEVVQTPSETEPGKIWLETFLEGDVQSAADLLSHLVSDGVTVAEYRQTGNDLEELFLELTATGE